MKENVFLKVLFSAFFIFGLVGFLAGVFVCIHIFSHNNETITTATITKIERYMDYNRNRQYDVIVSYNVNGKKYESRLMGYSTSFREGQEIEVYYKNDNPSVVNATKLDWLSLIFPAISFIFILVGGIPLIVLIKNSKKEKKLIEHGKKIYANFVEVKINSMYRVNNKSPYNIICQWNNPNDGKIYIFKSKNIWFNPQKIIEEKNIKMFPVYIDENNIKKYAMDTDEVTSKMVDLT